MSESLNRVRHLEKIDAVILAGGLGTRLRSVVGPSQKTMASIGERPFLDLLLEYLKKQLFSRIILCTGYQADAIERYYRKSSPGLDIVFSREESPLGTGGAVKKAEALIRSDPFFVLNGDSWCEVDYRALLAFHLKEQAVATLTLSRVKDSRDFGRVLLGNDARVVRFQEKSGPAEPEAARASAPVYVSAGVYCFDKNIFSLMPRQECFSIERDLFPHVLQQRVYGFTDAGDFMDIGTPERYEEAKRKLTDN